MTDARLLLLLFGIVARGAMGAPFACAGQPSAVFQAPVFDFTIDEPGGLTEPAAGVIPGATVQLDRHSRAIRRLEGAIAIPGAATPAAAAAAFVDSILRLPAKSGGPTILVADPDSSRQTLTGAVQTFQLHYANTDDGSRLPMPGNVVTVRLDREHRIVAASNDTIGVANPVRLQVTRGISADRAAAAAQQWLAERQQRIVTLGDPRRVVFVSRGTPVLIWYVQVLTASPSASLRVLIDAQSARVVSVVNAATYRVP